MLLLLQQLIGLEKQDSPFYLILYYSLGLEFLSDHHRIQSKRANNQTRLFLHEASFCFSLIHLHPKILFFNSFLYSDLVDLDIRPNNRDIPQCYHPLHNTNILILKIFINEIIWSNISSKAKNNY